MSIRLIVSFKGGARSGNWGHAGRPGKLGGSAPKRSQGGEYAGRMRTGQTGTIAVKTPARRRAVIAAGKVGLVDVGVRQKVHSYQGGDPSGKGWIALGTDGKDHGAYSRIEGNRAAHIKQTKNGYGLMVSDGARDKSHEFSNLDKQVAFTYGDGFVTGKYEIGDIKPAAGLM